MCLQFVLAILSKINANPKSKLSLTKMPQATNLTTKGTVRMKPGKGMNAINTPCLNIFLKSTFSNIRTFCKPFEQIDLSCRSLSGYKLGRKYLM